MGLMKFAAWFLASCGLLAAQDGQKLIGPIAHIGIKVADLEKTRAFYSGQLHLPEAYQQKDDSGKITLSVFMVNDNQFLEFSPGSPAGFTHVAFLTDKIELLRQFVENAGLHPPE